ncbi:MAG: hypothetical protein OEV64_09175 [Desulfobulbaceae bacterium]|nr:hypothetical protein [Desulfobulbaceae bacterium]
MEVLQSELGRRLEIADIAKWLSIDPKTVKKYHQLLGGIRLGPRKYIFFEKEVLSAIQKIRETQETMDWSAQEKGSKTSDQSLSNEKRGTGVGGLRKKEVYIIDDHNLFG